MIDPVSLIAMIKGRAVDEWQHELVNPELAKDPRIFQVLFDQVCHAIVAQSQEKEMLDVFKHCLQQGACLDLLYGGETSVLAMVYDESWPQTVHARTFMQMLINAGIRNDYWEHPASTIAHAAVIQGDPEMLALLQKAGVDMTMVDGLGETPIDLAIKYEPKPECHEVLQRAIMPECQLAESIKLGLIPRVIQRLRLSPLLGRIQAQIKTILCVDARRANGDLVNLPLEIWAFIINHYWLSTLRSVCGLKLVEGAEEYVCELAFPFVRSQLRLMFNLATDGGVGALSLVYYDDAKKKVFNDVFKQECMKVYLIEECDMAIRRPQREL